MDYKFKTERLDGREPKDVGRAARILRDGGTVAFPTETVYGLGANALSAEAVEKIFAAKQRPHWDPLIVHVCDRGMLEQVASAAQGGLAYGKACVHESLPGEAPEIGSRTVAKLLDAFWPGPFTLLLPRTSAVPDAVTAGRSLVGVRMPAHPVAEALIRAAGVPLAAPSANRFGHTSPTSAEHVLSDLDGRIDAVLDGGATEVGLESTVAELTPDGLLVYRPGAITVDRINALFFSGFARVYRAPEGEGPTGSQPSPGVSLRHYAPRARLLLVQGASRDARAKSNLPVELSLVEAIDGAFEADGKVGVMLPAGWHSSCSHFVYPWGDWGDGEMLARRLFAGLRELDGAGVSVIVCPVPELPGIGAALRDRLEKAARR